MAMPPFALPLMNSLSAREYAMIVYSSSVGWVSASHQVSARCYRCGLCPDAVAALMCLTEPWMALTFLYSFSISPSLLECSLLSSWFFDSSSESESSEDQLSWGSGIGEVGASLLPGCGSPALVSGCILSLVASEV